MSRPVDVLKMIGKPAFIRDGFYMGSYGVIKTVLLMEPVDRVLIRMRTRELNCHLTEVAYCTCSAPGATCTVCAGFHRIYQNSDEIRQLGSGMDTVEVDLRTSAEISRDLLIQIAQHLGPAVYERDDGSKSQEPLLVKLPSLVEHLAKANVSMIAEDLITPQHFEDLLARKVYPQIKKVYDLCGPANVPPPRIISLLADILIPERSGFLQWCSGHGTSHLWSYLASGPDPIQIDSTFEKPCPDHPDRRKSGD